MSLPSSKGGAQFVGNYELLERIAEGSMGSVYKGRHRTTGESVAIKTIPPETADNPVLLKRFQQEFVAASKINHPHIIRALDFGREDRSHYLVMEFVDGPNLGDRIEREGRLPEEEAVNLTVQVAQALDFAHSQKMIHRDVKPDNILITSDGQVKLADLGLVKDVNSNLDLTRPGTGLGTPNFMAPEQFGDAKNVDLRCDIYSLGATLYMAVTGVLPYDAKGLLAILKRKMENKLDPPRQLVAELSQRVNDAIMHAVRSDPKERPPSCAEFVRELTGRVMRRTGPGTAPSPLSRTVDVKPPGQPTGIDRRAAVRYASQRKGRSRPLSAEKEPDWSTRVRDVSATGIGLLMKRRFEPGTNLIVQLEATEDIPRSTLLVRVVRANKLAPKEWLLGCTLVRTMTDREAQAYQ